MKRREVDNWIKEHPSEGHPHYWCGGNETDCDQCNMDHAKTQTYLSMLADERALLTTKDEIGDKPMRLRVSLEESRKLIDEIPHETCRSAAERRWTISADGTVPATSVNWLFCWGRTGMGSRKAAQAAHKVFD
jgi:hypothetical protein